MERMINSGGLLTKKFLLKGLNCTHCAAKIEENVKKISEVKKANLNFALGVLTVTISDEFSRDIQTQIQEIAEKVETGIKVLESIGDDRFSKTHFEKREFFENRGLMAGIILFVLGILSGLIQPSGYEAIAIVFFILGYVIVGGPVILKAFRNLFKGQFFDENFLMTIATLGAFAIGEYPEGVAVMLFYLIGERLQERAVNRSRRSIQELMNIRPDHANLKTGDSIIKVSPGEVVPGDLIVVRPGERIPLDGTVTKGDSLVDTSSLTGEYVPSRIKAGDRVLSGTVNQTGLLTIRVIKPFHQSTVSRVLEMVEYASSKKAPAEKFITRFARYYTPLVVLMALGTAFLPPLLLPGAVFKQWLYRALIFLVISCPCALVISIPLGFFAGIGRASREGILVKGGNVLEALNHVEKVVFDKTGTLTGGVFSVTGVFPEKGFSKDELLHFASLAEANSNHPIARSILHESKDIDLKEKIESFQEFSGYGVKVKTSGKVIIAGNKKMLEREGIEFKSEGVNGTAVYVAVDGCYAGYLEIDDRIKADARDVIKELKKAGVKETVMLSGDNQSTVARVAGMLNLDRYFAELLPHQKVEKVEELLAEIKERGKLVFVGDGLNDAPVLARSDIGVAMGGVGSDAAIEAADVVLMKDEPAKLLSAMKIARKTRNIIWQNIFLALGVKVLVLIMGVVGTATMWEAVFADVGVALLAVLNSLRITKGV